jgi:hypothetical protein
MSRQRSRGKPKLDLSGPQNIKSCTQNIKSCKLIDAAIDGKPDKRSDNKRNLAYWGSAISRGVKSTSWSKCVMPKRPTTDAIRPRVEGALRSGSSPPTAGECKNVRAG